MKLVYSREARLILRHFPPESKKGIKEILEKLALDPYQGKALQRELAGYCSVPFKRYRIVYQISEKEGAIKIYSIALRLNVYEEFIKFLSRTSGGP